MRTAFTVLVLLLAAAAAVPGVTYGNGVWSTAHADPAAIRALGFEYGEASAFKSYLDRFWASHLKTMVWLGGYDTQTCSFLWSNAKVKERIREIKGHPGLYAYHIDDEPHAGVFDGDPRWKCRNTPAQIRARNALVKKLDPATTTVITENRLPSFRALANTTDVMVLDVFPCGKWGCDWKKIPDAARAARRAGVRRFWGATQSFGTDWYRAPTVKEQKKMIAQWNAARAEQDFVYTWDCCGVAFKGLTKLTYLWPTWRAENRLGR